MKTTLHTPNENDPYGTPLLIAHQVDPGSPPPVKREKKGDESRWGRGKLLRVNLDKKDIELILRPLTALKFIDLDYVFNEFVASEAGKSVLSKYVADLKASCGEMVNRVCEERAKRSLRRSSKRALGRDTRSTRE